MAEVREPGGLGYKVLTVLGILFFLVVVAVLIQSYDRDDEVAAVGPTVTAPAAAPAPSGPVETAAQAPAGAVATGGGGTAGDAAGTALPIFAGLVALTMITVGGVALRRREA